MALTPGQVRAESEPEAETEQPAQIVCDGLYSLTMSVNTMTLKRMGELTKYSYSSDRECEMAMTLIDVSSDDNPADITKTCSVTVAPIRPENSFDLTITESGECSTVAIDVDIDYGDSLSSNGAWAQSTETAADPPTTSGPSEDGVVGQASCVYKTGGDNPHMSSTRVHVSVHGWWNAWSDDCPFRSTVKVWLRAYYCWNEAKGLCAWITVGYGKEDVRSRRPWGDWVNARRHCGPATKLVSYLGIVDVDLIGQRDPPDKRYSDIEEFFCNP